MNDDMPTVEGALAGLGEGLDGAQTQTAPQTQGGALESLGGAVGGTGNPAFAATGVESLNPAPTPMTTGLPVTVPQVQGMDGAMGAAKAGGQTLGARNPSKAYDALMQSLKASTPPGLRNDGVTMKGTGWLGPQNLPNGGVATEYSVGVNIGGQEMDIPTLVPTLSQDELSQMTNDIIPNRKPIPNSIMQKAVDHAKGRMAQGQSVWANSSPAPMPQFTKVRSAFGGPDTYGYDYNGTQVAFPSGFNTNDQKAVKKYMDETNAIIDWINRDNEED